MPSDLKYWKYILLCNLTLILQGFLSVLALSYQPLSYMFKPACCTLNWLICHNIAETVQCWFAWFVMFYSKNVWAVKMWECLHGNCLVTANCNTCMYKCLFLKMFSEIKTLAVSAEVTTLLGGDFSACFAGKAYQHLWFIDLDLFQINPHGSWS